MLPSASERGFRRKQLHEIPIELRVAAGTFMAFMRRFGVRIITLFNIIGKAPSALNVQFFNRPKLFLLIQK